VRELDADTRWSGDRGRGVLQFELHTTQYPAHANGALREALVAHQSAGSFMLGGWLVFFEREEDAVWAAMTFPEWLATIEYTWPEFGAP
jgi:hypothetical protein